MTLNTMKKRPLFQRLTHSGLRFATAGFILQAASRQPIDDDGAVMGYTVSKKVGNAVERNRVKRRLRAVVRQSGVDLAQKGWDYVLVGRRNALSMDYAALLADFERAMGQIAKGKGHPAQEKSKYKPEKDRKAT